MGIIHWSLLYWCQPYATPLLIKNWHHRPIHRDEASKENCKYFGIAVMFVWKMQLFNTYISSTPNKGASCIGNKVFQMKIWPDMSPWQTMANLPCYELERSKILQNSFIILHFISKSIIRHCLKQFASPFLLSIMAIRRVSVFWIPD